MKWGEDKWRDREVDIVVYRREGGRMVLDSKTTGMFWKGVLTIHWKKPLSWMSTYTIRIQEPVNDER